MSSFIRKGSFWGKDLLFGGKIGSHLNEIEAFFESPDSQIDHITRRLSFILSHASRTTDFFEKYMEMKGLRQFPVIKKRHLQERGRDFLSSDFSTADLTERKTSGSYSTPMRVYFSEEKMSRQYAELIYYNRLSGLDVGEKYYNITTNKKGRAERFLKNVVIINPAVMDEEWFVQTIKTIQAEGCAVIVGFPSVLYALANYVLSHKTYEGRVRFKGIITIAEALHPSIRGAIEEAFGCPVFNRYATMETGVVGHSLKGSPDLQINRASYIAEVLAFDSDRPVAVGEEGRIVITDLFSEAMPLIRYETGDTAVLASVDEFGARSIKVPEGRIIETIYGTNGDKISWAVLYDLMITIPDVIQYQFRQTGERSYELHLVTAPAFSSDSERLLNQEFHEMLGSDATMKFNYTDSIPALPSGKRPMIINDFRRNN